MILNVTPVQCLAQNCNGKNESQRLINWLQKRLKSDQNWIEKHIESKMNLKNTRAEPKYVNTMCKKVHGKGLKIPKNDSN